MLRKTRKMLKKLLSGVFKYSLVSVSGEMVTVRSYYLTKVRKYRIIDLIAITIPDRMRDADMANSYRKSVNSAIRSGKLSEAIQNAYEMYFEDIKQGKKEPTPHEEFNVYQWAISKVKRLRIEARSVKKPGFLKFRTVKNLKEAAKETIKDVNETYLSVVSTGNAAFDEQFRQVRRYATAA